MAKLAQQLKQQTVTNIRQYLTEQVGLVKKTFRDIRILEANQAALDLPDEKLKTNVLELLVSGKKQTPRPFFW